MTTALPDGTQIAEWGGFKLHDYLSAWQDSNVGRIAQHTFDRRDGAQSEDMGSAARETRVTLVFADKAGFDACRKFVELWRQNKTRLFVHPIWGRFNATFVGIESGALTVDQGANLYTVQGKFVESNINAATVANDSSSVPTQAGNVRSQTTVVTTAAEGYSAATIATVATFTTAATTASAAALAAASTGTPDPAVSSLINVSITDGSAAIVAIRAEVSDGPAAYTAVAACEVLAAMMMDLGAAYLAQQPPLVEYVLGDATPLLTVANMWYPGQAVNRMSEIRAFNPTLPPGLIVPAGFRLQLASA